MTQTALEWRVEAAMSKCGKCRALSPEEKAEHRQHVLDELAHPAPRTFRTLPASVWPNGRPPIEVDIHPPTKD